jgi:anti-sigma regulatory factor (Ser/Thr protein kinase)
MTRVGNRLTLEIKNSIDALPPAIDEAAAWLKQRHATPADVWFVTLAMDELVTNSIKYGWTDSREHVIQVDLGLADGQITIAVNDDGQPFNPLEVPEPDLSGDIDERQIGGLGIHLLRKVSDAMTYERRDDRNQVVLVKRM